MTLKAVVVMNKGEFDPNSATKKLQDYVKEKLLPYKYPREIRFIANCRRRARARSTARR
jgi:acetyl-CoA synthetase